MKGIKTWILIGIIALSLYQSSGKLECLIFLSIMYFLICKISKKLFSVNPKKENEKLYKYEDFDNELEEIVENSEALKQDLDEAVSEAEINVLEHRNRISEYDFREFAGRKNVPWEDVYDYLWLHCRYKGIPMWMEYMNELEKNGVISDEDIKKIFKKAGNYIPWTHHPELEAKMQKDDEKVRNSDKNYELMQKRNSDFIEYLNNVGIFEGCEEYYKKEKESCEVKYSDEHLKCFYYDEYLKRKGYV